tara:strand:+ start:2610 stop:2726 length:117 start_codon:yes stop_codon:yes gene_type:complete
MEEQITTIVVSRMASMDGQAGDEKALFMQNSLGLDHAT